MKYYYFVLIGNERNPVTVKIVVLVKISGKISLIFSRFNKNNSLDYINQEPV